VQLAGGCAPWKFTGSAENLVLQALQARKTGVCHETPGEPA